MLYSLYFSFGQETDISKKNHPKSGPWGRFQQKHRAFAVANKRSCITGVSTFFSTSPTFAFASFTGFAGFQVPSWRTLDTPKSVTFRWLWPWKLLQLQHDLACLGMISHTRLGTCCCRPSSQVMQVRLRFEANNEASNPIFADPSQSTDRLLSTWHVPLRELPTSEVLGCRVPGSLYRGRCACSRCFGNRVNTRSMLRKLRTDSGSPWKANKRFFFTTF